MKKVFIASLVAAALVPGLAFSQTLSLTGTVAENTCALDVAGATATSQTVVMRDVQLSNLSGANDHALGGTFNVQLRNCGSTSKNVRLEFPNTTGVDTLTGRMTNSGNARNVQVALRAGSASTTDLMLGSANAVTPRVASATNGTATIPMSVFYVANGGAAGTGTVQSSVQFNIGYQ